LKDFLPEQLKEVFLALKNRELFLLPIPLTVGFEIEDQKKMD
jgi:hypothetical protein